MSGIITSLQLNQAGAPQWLKAGSWTLVMFPSHHISDFKLLGVTHPGQNTTLFNGTMTVITENGPTQNVAGYLDFQNNRMSIWVNPGAINNHFGPTPINGIILNAQQLQEIGSLESANIQPGAMATSTSGNTTR